MTQVDVAVRNVVSRLEPLAIAWNERVTKRPVSLLPPARPDEIEARQKHWDLSFPPTYRSFLQIHNGWLGFEMWDIFGASGPAFDELYPRYKADMAFFESEYKKRGARHVAKLRKNEVKRDDVIYLPNHVPCGIGPERYYLVFDRNRQDENGEYAIALVGTGDNVHGRYDSFLDFMTVQITEFRGKLREDHGIDPDEIEAAARSK